MADYILAVAGIILVISVLTNLILGIRIQQLTADLQGMKSRMDVTAEELDSLSTRLDEIKQLTLR
ncbi:MAG: hypothetical protein U9N07_08175 [Euryarchaeota archaeon]|nr:hypothetical protein [Euryarchaeota archaeon]